MLQFKDVPYRRYVRRGNGYRIIVTREYKRVMKIIGDAIRDGKSVDFHHAMMPGKHLGMPLDTISVTIQD